MFVSLEGAPVAAAIKVRTENILAGLKEKGIRPTLGVVRVGNKPGDLSYEKGLRKRCAELQMELTVRELPADACEEAVLEAVRAFNADAEVHGILVFRPLPAGTDERKICDAVSPAKDVDGASSRSLAGLLTGVQEGFTPSCPQAAMEILDHYGIAPAGRRAVVLGRSLVVGRPLALLLTSRDATVTVCHSRSADTKEQAKAADILIAATGRPGMVDADYLHDGQTVLDIGLSWDEKKQKLSGDVDSEAAKQAGCALSPVPGGVGSVCNAVLMLHVAEAAARSLR